MKLKFLILLVCLNIFNSTAQSAGDDSDAPKEMTLEEALKDKYIYWEDGKATEVVAIKRNHNNGYYEGFFENGVLAVKGKKKNQLMIGEWKYYYKNSVLKKYVKYNQDEDPLLIQEYDSNENINLEKRLVDNSIDDYYVYETKYFQNGKLVAKGKMHDSDKEGEWNAYDSDGKVIRTVLFENDEEISEIKKIKTEEIVSYKAKQSYSGFGPYVEKLERGWESGLWSPYDKISEFDLNGNKIKRKYVKPNGDLHQIYSFTYDNSDNLIKNRIYWANGDRYTNSDYEYDYDSNGNILQKYETDKGEYEGKIEYRYDANNNLIEKRTYLDDEYNYSDKDVKIYDNYNNMISSVRTFSDGKIYEKTFTYDSRNNKTKKVTKNNDGTFDVINYKYDTDDNLIEEKEYRNKNLFKVFKYKYDEDGNKIEFIKTYYSNGVISESKRYEYSYDYEDNELYKTVIYIADEPVFIIEREITYYGDDY